jgi:ParB/RepB/Spo0J family partition protein
MDTVELELHKIDFKYSHLRTRNSRAKARLIASLSEFGQQNPVLVVPGDNQRYVLIDGYRRISAVKKLAQDTVDALVLSIDEASALFFWHSQEQTNTRSALEDGWFLQELIEQHNQTQESLAKRLQKSESWISRRLSLVTELPLQIQELVRRGNICPYAAGKYLVPLARAKKSDCVGLVANLGQRKTSSRELEALYKAWCKGNRKTREQIVREPKLFLKINEKVIKPRMADKKEKKEVSLLRDIEVLAAICCRAQVNFRDHSAQQGENINKAWSKAKFAFLALERLIHEGKTNVG